MDFTDMRIHQKEVGFIRAFMQFSIASYINGALFFITDQEKVTYTLSNKFCSNDIVEGTLIGRTRIAEQVIQDRKAQHIVVNAEVFGQKLLSIASPVWSDDETQIIGSWALCTLQPNQIIAAFDSFAPLVADLLPEGGVLLLADKNKFIKKQASTKFDMTEVTVNAELHEGSTQTRAFMMGKQISYEFDASIFGVPVLGVSSPIYDADGKVEGTFSFMLPRQMARELKEIAKTLDQGLTEISSAVEQISSASSDASNNQTQLHAEIECMKGQLENINNVMAFTKEIANATKMLGINAAIEAARVGEAGRGFSVVAEEIQKLSEESKSTVTKIKEMTQKIEKSMNTTAEQSQATLDGAQQTAAATQEVNASLEEMTALADKLAGAAAKL